MLLPAFFRHYTLIALGCGVAGLRLGGPASTRPNTYEGLGWTPKPTPGISQASPGAIELLRRQDTRSNTCGYIDRNLENTFTCFTGTQTCVFANDGAVNCCDLVTDAAGSSYYVACEFFTSCVNWLDLSSCSGDCLTDEDVRRCSKRQSPYCITYSWPDIGYSYLGCGDVSFSSNAYRSYSSNPFNQGSLPPLVTYNILISTTASSITSTTISSVTGSSAPSGTSSATGANTPVGAIVGGVIGGLIVIAACIITAWLIVSAKKNRSIQQPSIVPNHHQIYEVEAGRRPLVEAGSVPIVEAPGSFPSGEAAGSFPSEEARLSDTPLPSQTGGSSGGSPGQEGNLYMPSSLQPGYSFASPMLPERGLGLERIGDTPLPSQHGGTSENPTLPGSSPDQERIGGPQ